MGQNRSNDQETPRQSSFDPAEGARDSDSNAQRNSSVTSESGRGSSGERNSAGGGGISNRGREREMAEQEELPERGDSQSER